MKVAILTQPLDGNYGGILQCYALQTVLERIGHEVCILTKPRYGYSYFVIYPFSVLKRIAKRYLLGKNVDIFKPPHEIRRKNIDRFIRQYIHQYKCKVFTEKLVDKFDAFVVGSDQVWRPAYSKPIEEAFFSFLGDSRIKRIAYAASFGVDNCDEFSTKQIIKCSILLKKFDAISVREFSGISLCENIFGVRAVQMLDPTLLLSAEDYKVLINNAITKPSKGNMLVYIIDKTDDKVMLVNTIASEKGLIPLWLDSPVEIKENVPLDEMVKMSVEQWLRCFLDVEYVFTDSFHGCIFSLIFKKQFLVYGNKERGLSRFNSLLRQFSLEDRLILSSSKYKKNLPMINYDNLLGKLSVLQNKSVLFLKKYL